MLNHSAGLKTDAELREDILSGVYDFLHGEGKAYLAEMNRMVEDYKSIGKKRSINELMQFVAEAYADRRFVNVMDLMISLDRFYQPETEEDRLTIRDAVDVVLAPVDFHYREGISQILKVISSYLEAKREDKLIIEDLKAELNESLTDPAIGVRESRFISMYLPQIFEEVLEDRLGMSLVLVDFNFDENSIVNDEGRVEDYLNLLGGGKKSTSRERALALFFQDLFPVLGVNDEIVKVKDGRFLIICRDSNENGLSNVLQKLKALILTFDFSGEGARVVGEHFDPRRINRQFSDFRRSYDEELGDKLKSSKDRPLRGEMHIALHDSAIVESFVKSVLSKRLASLSDGLNSSTSLRDSEILVNGLPFDFDLSARSTFMIECGFDEQIYGAINSGINYGLVGMSFDSSISRKQSDSYRVDRFLQDLFAREFGNMELVKVNDFEYIIPIGGVDKRRMREIVQFISHRVFNFVSPEVDCNEFGPGNVLFSMTSLTQSALSQDLSLYDNEGLSARLKDLKLELLKLVREGKKRLSEDSGVRFNGGLAIDGYPVKHVEIKSDDVTAVIKLGNTKVTMRQETVPTVDTDQSRFEEKGAESSASVGEESPTRVWESRELIGEDIPTVVRSPNFHGEDVPTRVVRRPEDIPSYAPPRRRGSFDLNDKYAAGRAILEDVGKSQEGKREGDVTHKLPRGNRLDS